MVVLGTTIHEFASDVALSSYTLFRHPGQAKREPGSIVEPHVLLMNGPRLKAGVTAVGAQ